MNQDWIVLSEHSFPCVLGIHDWEQTCAQTLRVELGMALDLGPAASGDLAASVDYATMLEQIELIATAGRWRMLESMAAAMAHHVLTPPAESEGRVRVDAVRIKLTKPDVFRGRAVPSVEIQRDRAWYRSRSHANTTRPGVTTEILAQSPETGAYHVSLQPRAQLQLAKDASVRVIAGRVRCDDTHAEAGSRACTARELRGEGDKPSRVLVVSEGRCLS